MSSPAKKVKSARASERARDPISTEPIKRLIAEATGLRVSEDAGKTGRVFVYEVLRDIAEYVAPILRFKKAKTVDVAMLESYVSDRGHQKYNVLVSKKKVQNSEGFSRDLPQATIARVFKQISGVERLSEQAKEALVTICEERIKQLATKANDFAHACQARTILGRHVESALKLMNH